MLKETYVAEFKILSKKYARRPEKKHYRRYNSWLSGLDLIPILKSSSYNCYPLEISQVVESVTWSPYCPRILNVYASSKHFFIIPTDAHNYMTIGMLKTIIKIPTIAPICFGSRRNHHQGAISCLAKTTIMILVCSSLMTWSMLWRHTSLLCKRAVVLAKQEIAPWLWFLREPKHVGAIVGILIIVLTFLWSYNCVHQLE
jgi:hypothetical protein